MPTIISHAITATPISLGFIDRINKRKIIILSIIFSILPDLDGIGFQFGIKYNSLFGHRGFSHSLLFIIIMAIIFTYFLFPKIKLKSKAGVILFLNFFTIGALHITLDAMTNGGLGVALFSPFSNQRLFLPWRPIEVSAILPQYFFQLDGFLVIKFELLYLVLPSILLSLIIIFLKKKMICGSFMLKIIKTAHTLIWIIMVLACFYILYAGITNTFDLILVISIILLIIEILVLIFNNWTCPFTPLAEKYTTEKSYNFDIYIPNWLAKYNKLIFGIIFVTGLVLVAFNWIRNF